MDKDEALNTLAKVFHNGEEMEDDDSAVMVVDLALWNEGCEAIEALIGSAMSVQQKMLWASIGAIFYQIAHAVFTLMTGYTAEEMAKFARSIL